MALQKSVVDLPFTTGLGLAADDRLAPNGAMQRLDNMHLSESGAALVRREAQLLVADGSAMSGSAPYPLVLHAYKKELVARTLDGVKTLIPQSSGLYEWNGDAGQPDLLVEQMPAHQDTFTDYFSHAVTEDGKTSLFHTKRGYAYYNNTVRALLTSGSYGSASDGMLTRIGNAIYIFTMSSSPFGMAIYRVTNFESFPIIPTKLITAGPASSFDVVERDCVQAEANSIAAAACYDTSMTVYLYDVVGLTAKTNTIALASDSHFVNVGYDPARKYIFVATTYTVGKKVEVRVFDANTPGLTQVGATTTITKTDHLAATMVPYRIAMNAVCNPMKLAVAYYPANPTGTAANNTGVWLFGESDTTGVQLAPGGLLLGRPFPLTASETVVAVAPADAVGGAVQFQSATQTYARINQGIFGPQFNTPIAPPPPVYAQPDGYFDVNITWGISPASSLRYRVKAVASTDNPSTQAVTFGGLAVFSGIEPLYYDGANTVAAGAMSVGPVISFKEQTGSAITTAGVHQFTAVFTWKDANGRIHRSPPAIPITVDTTATGTGAIWIKALPYPLTPKPPGLRFDLYTTTVNGTTMYLAGSFVGDGPTPLGNLAVSDAALQGQEILYTTGGILDSYGMPPTSCMTVHQHRLFVSNPDDNQIYYSLSDDDALGPRFNPELKLDAGEETTTALGSFEDKLIIFKRTAIYAIFGQGPDNAGNGANFSFVQLISSDTGCIDCRSVTLGAKGLYFEGLKGFYLLTPGLQVAPVGIEVERLSSGNVYSWAKTMPLENQIIFGRQGEQLLYDEVVGQWSRFASATGRLGEVWREALTLCPNDGSVYQQNGPLGLDSGTTAIDCTIETGWLKFGSIQGFERLWRVLLLGAHQRAPNSDTTGALTISYRVNYNETQTFTLGSATVPAGTDGTNWQLRYHMPHQKIEAVKFIVTYNSAGRSHVFSGMSFEVAGKIGTFKKQHAVAP